MEPEERVNQEEVHSIELENRIKELEKNVSEKDAALAQATNRIAETEASRNDLSQEIASLKEQNAAVRGNLDTIKGSLSEAVKTYRELVLKSSPDIPAELVSGESIAELNESLTKAKGLVSRVKQTIEANITGSRIPAGAPARIPRDLTALSAHEKITYGIRKD